MAWSLMQGYFKPVFIALAAALLFGASTPFSKYLLAQYPPQLLAGLLYLGSGVGLMAIRFLRDRRFVASGLTKKEWCWFSGAIFFGGILAPVFLMFGLMATTAASASLLLNLETVFTAMLAWIVFKEHTDRRIVLGMCLIVAGGIALSWSSSSSASSSGWGPLMIAMACFCWAIDNNLTRQVSASDALFIAGNKGLVAGVVNVMVALCFGASLPHVLAIFSALSVGFFGYGISLVFFVLALRYLGTARTGAYFSTAPFMGAAIAIVFFHDTTTILFWISAGLMAAGVWLHLTEKHEHEHTHPPHTYPDQPESLTHTHPHYPDIYHRHKH